MAQPTTVDLKIILAERVVSETSRGVRTIETSHPPTYYLPPKNIAADMLQRANGGSFCEWKGAALYYDVVVGDRVLPGTAWSYPNPSPSFSGIRDYVAFYAGGMDGCLVDGERVEPSRAASMADESRRRSRARSRAFRGVAAGRAGACFSAWW